MFDDFLRNCPMKDEIKPSKKHIRKNFTSVKSLIDKEENASTKRRFRLKPLVIAAVISIISVVSLLTVGNASRKPDIVKFVMGVKEIEGEYYDYVDKDGFRRITFDAVLPLEENTYAMVYDVDAPQGENVRVLTPETDPEFFENLRLYLDDRDKSIKESAAMWDKINAWKGDYDKSDSRLRDAVLQEAIQAGIIDPSEVPEEHTPEDYLFVCKDSELCVWEYIYRDEPGFDHSRVGSFGGEFLNMGKSGEQKFEEKRLGDGTKAIKHTFYYYVGKE